MNTTEIDYKYLKLTKGVDPGHNFTRDINIIKSFSKEKYSEFLSHILELHLSDEPIDSQTLKKWIEDFGETEARVNSAINITMYLLKKASIFELTNEEFENDLEILGLNAHKESLITSFVDSKNKIIEKNKQSKYSFYPEIKVCEWRLDHPVKVSTGQPYDEELIALLNFGYEDIDGTMKYISFEIELSMLKVVVNTCENCLTEGEKWEAAIKK